MTHVRFQTAGTEGSTGDHDQRALAPRVVLLGFAALGVLLLTTATWSYPYNVDSYTNIVQARAFADDGSPIVEEYAHVVEPKYTGAVVWIVDSPDGPTSQYPPGVALWGSLFYLIDTSTTEIDAVWTNDGVEETVALDVPSLVPAALAAVTAVLGALIALFAMLRREIGDRAAAVAVGITGLGTGLWSVAADQLWQHSVTALFISLGLWSMSQRRHGGAGLAFAAAALVRPHTLLIAAGAGLAESYRERSVLPALRVGSAASLGLVALVFYNRWVWGGWSISGGYGSVFSDRARGTSPLTFLSRIVEMLVHLDHGVLVSSPVVALAVFAVFSKWRTPAPAWAVGAAIGGCVYLALQLQANRVSGGNQIFGYRYPLETIVAAAPLAAIRVRQLTFKHIRWRSLLAALAAVSIAAHGYGAFFVTA